MNLSPSQKSLLLDIARATIRRRLANEPVETPSIEDAQLKQPASCFVTLHRLDDHRLRGCIGELQSERELVESVVRMSHAVLDDPRFFREPVTLGELPELELEITVLSPLELAKDALDFDLLEHGIYLVCAGTSGCFLPQVARETGWSRQQLLARLCSEKMGLPEDAWRRDDAKLYRFTATIVGPEPFVMQA